MKKMNTLTFPDGSTYEIVDYEARQNIAHLSSEIANLQTSGLTTAQVNALDGMFKKCAFTANATEEYEAFKTAFGISGGGTVEPEEPEEPDTPEVTVSSIDVSYNGGDVAIGTELTELVSDIVLTATYSDGSVSEVTDYELSGKIVEGSNTITVSYQGLTTIFVVNGVAVPIYTFENTTNSAIANRNGEQTGSLTVTNGNHIKFTNNVISSTWYDSVNISSFASNGQNATDITDTWFTIPAGATVKLCLRNAILTGVYQIRLALGKQSSIHDILRFVHDGAVEDNGERTITLESDTNIPCITMSVGPTVTGGTEPVNMEFDFELYVNEERWI